MGGVLSRMCLDKGIERVPEVSVIIPVYNGEQFLREAVESILQQTFADFELVICDDGSTDRTWEIIQSFGDKRIRALRSVTNLGIACALNKGLHAAKGQYIAIMHADDIALPTRLERQTAFLRRNKDVKLVGTGVLKIDENGTPIRKVVPPSTHEEICRDMWRHNPFAHSSVMYERSIVLSMGGYNEGLVPSEDYDLWFRIIRKCKVANLSEVLTYYRIHAGSASNTRDTLELRTYIKILYRELREQDVGGRYYVYLFTPIMQLLLPFPLRSFARNLIRALLKSLYRIETMDKWRDLA